SDIDVAKLIALWPVPTFYITFTIMSAILGFFGGKVLKLSSAKTRFITAGIMFNNVTSLPLGLLRGIKNTSAMNLLVMGEMDTPEDSLKRGKSYILLAVLFGTLLSDGLTDHFNAIFRWSFGAILLKKEKDEDPLAILPTETSHVHPVHQALYATEITSEPDESTQLLITPKKKRTTWTKINNLSIKCIVIIKSIMNPPLCAAGIALIVGIIPPLKGIFFGENATLSVLSEAIDYIGTITIPMTLILLGSQLNNMRYSKGKDLLSAISYVVTCRFLIMPIFGVILVLITRFWYMHDPMLWFVLMLFASGPTAIGCLNLAQLNGSFEEEMAALLFYSYLA
ncbi:3029_t:CDS:2, partial [Acaulospora colombiana]